MIFPAQVKVSKLLSFHPEYEANRELYDEISILFDGGKRLKQNITKFLRKRPKELPDVYVTRQLGATYTNLLSNIVGWYGSAIFKTAPQILRKPRGGVEGAQIPADAAAFCDEFERNCDLAGTALVEFWPAVLESLLLYRSSWVLIDLPLPDAMLPAPANLAEQERRGLLDPYLVSYDADQVINWSTDAYGSLDWVVIYTRTLEQRFMDDAGLVDNWYFFDRAQCALYQRDVPADEKQLPDNALASLVEGYPRPHAMAGMGRVPLRRVIVPKGLWLANRVYLPLLNHFNLDNSLDFGLFQSNLAQLVIVDGDQGTYDDSVPPAGGPPVSSAVGYHHLPHGGNMFYLEPDGKSFAASQTRIDNLEERIYKACYLLDQARTNRSTPTAQSGISKSMDKTPSRDAMCAFGDKLRAAMQNVYQDALQVRGFDDVEIDIRGLDFSDKATSDDLDLLGKSTVIPVNSTTFERQIAKQNVRLSLPDANPALLQTIDAEIDANPTPSEQQQQQQEEQRGLQLQQFSKAFQGASEMTS